MQYIKEKIKEMLSDFASEDYQRSEWLKEQTWFFPNEFICVWFDDTFFFLDRLIKNHDLTKEEWEIIRPFHELFDKYADKISQKKFNDNPRLLLDYRPWKKIQKKAGETLEKLRKIGWQ